MKKTAKILLLSAIAFFFSFLFLFAAGDYYYPDRIHLYQGESVQNVFGFSVEEENDGRGRILALGFVPVKEVEIQYYKQNTLIPGGEVFGVRLHTKGLLVTEIGEVETENGKCAPGKDAGLEKGDVILSVNGVQPDSASAFSKLIAKNNGKAVKLLVKRNGQEIPLSLTPSLARDKSGYKAGIWVRDGAAGLGTVTFQNPKNGEFAGLGHPICDSETGIPFPLAQGEVCQSTILGIEKGKEGKPGEIRGRLEGETLGSLRSNNSCGVFGTLNKKVQGKAVPIGKKEELKQGDATILCTLDDQGKKEYHITIEEIFDLNRETKNFVIRVTDPALLEKTGGIVQGMSGSPILQNGKIVGAVTHVFVQDPTRGYGIFIENMLNAAG